MKTLKTTTAIVSVFILFLSFTACKKNNSKPEDEFDITQYYIVGKMGTSGISIPYIITFDANAKSNAITLSVNSQSSYTYKDGTLTMDFGGGTVYVFKISDENITSFEGTDQLENYKLVKIPATNQLAGNTYNGSWKTPGSLLFVFTKFKFTDTQYGEASLNEPVPDKDYTLIKNIAATSTTGANGLLSFWVLIDGKLEGAKYNPTTEKVSYGIFTKQ